VLFIAVDIVEKLVFIGGFFVIYIALCTDMIDAMKIPWIAYMLANRGLA
jgi:hypothetical protein